MSNKTKKKSKLDLKLDVKSILADLTSTRSILFKMVVVFLLLIIVPLSILGFIATKTASDNLQTNAENSVIAATRQTSGYFDTFLDKAQNVSIQILANTVIQKFTTLNRTESDGYERIMAKQDANSALNSINNSTNDLNAKLLYDSGDVLGNMIAPENMENIFSTQWYQKVKDAHGKAVWTEHGEGMSSTTTSDIALSLLRVYKDPVSSLASGVIIVDINYTPVKNILSGIDLGLEDTTYLLTQEGKVLSEMGTKESENLSERQFIKDVIQRSATEDTGLFHSIDNKTDYLVSYYKSTNTDLVTITVVPNSVITKGANQIMTRTITTGIIFILVAGAIGFVFSLGMTLSMKSITDVMSKAENGDLTVSISMRRKDEFGRLADSFNKMFARIREMVIQNKHAAEEVVKSSDKMAVISDESSRISTEIANAIVEVASGTSNQASEIENSVKNVTELADRITSAVEKTKAMEADSEYMKELSDYGLVTIDNLNQKTAQTNELTSNVVRNMSQLNQYVKNINVITNVLRSIADQTNLLALNAAIEAARAGAAGKGFAVVADEIRKLAEQSNNHTRDIQKHIENVFKQTQSSTELVGEAEASIMEQSEMVTKTAEAFTRINKTTTALGENISQVGRMISDMDAYKQSVISSMENISAVSEEVSASAQEVSASTEEQLTSIDQLDDMAKQLNEMAGNLITQMEKFKV
jgi:methyl-accepting chemotaxis protein